MASAASRDKLCKTASRPDGWTAATKAQQVQRFPLSEGTPGGRRIGPETEGEREKRKREGEGKRDRERGREEVKGNRAS